MITKALLVKGLISPGAAAWLAKYSSSDPALYKQVKWHFSLYTIHRNSVWNKRNASLTSWHSSLIEVEEDHNQDECVTSSQPLEDIALPPQDTIIELSDSETSVTHVEVKKKKARQCTPLSLVAESDHSSLRKILPFNTVCVLHLDLSCR